LEHEDEDFAHNTTSELMFWRMERSSLWLLALRMNDGKIVSAAIIMTSMLLLSFVKVEVSPVRNDCRKEAPLQRPHSSQNNSIIVQNISPTLFLKVKQQI